MKTVTQRPSLNKMNVGAINYDYLLKICILSNNMEEQKCCGEKCLVSSYNFVTHKLVVSHQGSSLGLSFSI